MCNDDSCRLGMPFTTDRSYMHLGKVENNFCGGKLGDVKRNGEHRISQNISRGFYFIFCNLVLFIFFSFFFVNLIMLR